jgi:hypothetical protein
VGEGVDGVPGGFIGVDYGGVGVGVVERGVEGGVGVGVCGTGGGGFCGVDGVVGVVDGGGVGV